MSSVARSDEAIQVSDLAGYYAESGTPPGMFFGAGLTGLAGREGIAEGSTVSEQQLFRMLGMLQDPVTGQQLGRAPRQAVHSADGQTLAAAVAGFDLTFSAPKSVSVAWALADPPTRELILEAHQWALREVIRYAERQVFASRSGKNGVVQLDVRGVVAVAFDHWDSRAGDPQLHTHVVVLNRAQTSDGKWRTLDSRALFKAVVGLSELYNGLLADNLTAALGWGWEPTRRIHSDVPKYEVAGVPAELREEFSRRSQDIENHKNGLVRRFVGAHSRQPTSAEVLRLRQQSTLQTRPDKQMHSLPELIAGWRTRATEAGAAPERWVNGLRDRNELPLLQQGELDSDMLARAATTAIGAVSERRATFTRSNVFAEVLRQLHGVRFASASDRIAVAEQVVELSLERTLAISPPELAHTPTQFRRPDGSSRLRSRDARIYTTQQLLDAEDRLLEAGRATDGPRIPPTAAAGQSVGDKAFRLAKDQVAAVQQITASGLALDVLVGPAGTGKSHTMSGLRGTWEQIYGPGSVIGLAPSAAAAEVLASELGIEAENTAKWLTEHRRQLPRHRARDALVASAERHQHPIARRSVLQQLHQIDAEIVRWSLRRGQLLIIDEASLAGTLALDEIVLHARIAGAKVLLVGDWAQLDAVNAGGAFQLLVRDRDNPAELTEARRFTHGWERDASIALRRGDHRALGSYQQNNRVCSGEREDILDQLFRAWLADAQAGAQSIMLAGDNDTVGDLNRRARAARVDAGQVTPEGVLLASGSTAGVGDTIITGLNQRSLKSGTGWVKNGDVWTVTAIARDGSLTARRARGAGTTVLPAGYVGDYVELGYATSAHKAQGRTVDTAHAYVSATTRRELLYVMATRGRESNHLYVDTSYDPDQETQHMPPALVTALQILNRVLDNEGRDVSATEAIQAEYAERYSLKQLWAEYEAIAKTALIGRYKALLRTAGLARTEQDRVAESEAFDALLAAFAEAEARGLDIGTTLPRLVQRRPFTNANDIASILHRRVEQWIRAHGDLRVEHRIAGLFPQAIGVEDPDLQQALRERRQLIEARALDLAMQAIQANKPWLAMIGVAPAGPDRYRIWLKAVKALAAYRDYWQIPDIEPNNIVTNSEQAAHLRSALRMQAVLRGPIPAAGTAVEVELRSADLGQTAGWATR